MLLQNKQCLIWSGTLHFGTRTFLFDNDFNYEAAITE